MAAIDPSIDRYIARSLSSAADPEWPCDWDDPGISAQFVNRAFYHGVAGLLTEHRLDKGPQAVVRRLREQSVAQAMWEIRHQDVISSLLDGLANAGVLALILKGTALAYDLYDKPEVRARGDTDILVDRSQLAKAREVLAARGFRRDTDFDAFDDEFQNQESWWLGESNLTHIIDLHWHPINSLALRETLTFADCASDKRPLPRLSGNALTVARPIALLHCCVHRAGHFRSPYIVDGRPYFGGDRLIWAKDIDLLAGALDDAEWNSLCAAAIHKGLAGVILHSFDFATSTLGTNFPPHVIQRLKSCGQKRSAPSIYLMQSGQASRALRDLGAIPGLSNKLRYLVRRALPPPGFLRSKYPTMARFPLIFLGLRRFAELFVERGRQSATRPQIGGEG